LIEQWKQHEAFCLKPLERKFKTVGDTNSAYANLTNSINSNQASHFVIYFTKNENSEQRFITQHEKK